MAQSTTTTIEVVNKVLLNVGERMVNAFSSPTSLKALYSVEEALRELENLDDWSFTRQIINAESWTNEFAVIPNFQRIHNVTFITPQIRRELQFLDTLDFLMLVPKPFDSTMISVHPFYYTIRDDDTVAVDIYPTDVASMNYFFFSISKAFTIGSTPTSTLPLPERLVPLVIVLASFNMAVRHLDDTSLGATFRKQFESMLITTRNRERLTPTRGTNMYKRRNAVSRGVW